MLRQVEFWWCRRSGRSNFDLMLKYVVQHFGFVYYSEFSSGGEPFVRDWKRICALVWLSAGVTSSFFSSDTTPRPSSMRNESEKLLSIAVSLIECGAVSVSVMPKASRLQKRRNWLSRGSNSWHNSMLLMAIWFTETSDLLPLRTYPKIEASRTTEGEMRSGGLSLIKFQ